MAKHTRAQVFFDKNLIVDTAVELNNDRSPGKVSGKFLDLSEEQILQLKFAADRIRLHETDYRIVELDADGKFTAED